MNTDLAATELLKRTKLTITFNQLLTQIEKQYPNIANIISYTPIAEGYEDANFLLTTRNKKYVLKIFSYERLLKNIQDTVTILDKLTSQGVPVTKLVKGTSGYLTQADQSGNSVYFMITDFFEGQNYFKKTPTLEEVILVTNYLAQINSLTDQVAEGYDSFGNKNLIAEYKKHESILSSTQKAVIVPMITQLRKIDISSFSQSFTHGDFQRKHIIKGDNGKYCILDFGCMSYTAKVIDLSMHLAWFVLQPDTWEKRDDYYSSAIKEYLKFHSLSKEEIHSLPILTKSAWVAYYMATSRLMNQGDKSSETLEWHKLSKEMMQLSENWNPKLTFPL